MRKGSRASIASLTFERARRDAAGPSPRRGCRAARLSTGNGGTVKKQTKWRVWSRDSWEILAFAH